ncbi:formate dehydrogenase subunit alpha [Dickeya fangzhongdai]|uniref:formate dehydrogenase subunit alpha n=1 Tax=Dickeya fangzhongdai TaxID=1778540 RepID=UPI00090786D1|nr:formate dehydrogenase subunit alpha [Dickeya fangzhongdai]
MAQIKTVCPYCGTGCSMYLNVENGRIKSVEGDPEHPVSQGELCLKGLYGFEHVGDRRRLTSPLIKRNDKFEPVSWDEVLDYLADRFKANKEQYGNDAFALFASARANNEDNYAAQKFTRAVIGTNNIDHCARICHSSTVSGLGMTLGSGLMTNTIPEIGNDSDVILIIGSNTAECHPLIARQVIWARSRGAKLIVIDPRYTDMANKADLYIKAPVGYNIPIVNALLHVIIKEKLYKEDFVAQHATGFEEMARAVEDYSPETVETLTSIPAEQLTAAARLYAKAKAATILYAMGITQFTHGTANVVALSNLAVITGQIGRPGAGLCPLRGQNNVQGACDLGALPNVFPSYLSVTDEYQVQHFEQAWQTKLSRKVGLKVTEVPHAIEEGKLHTLFVFGENPLMSDPDSDELRHAFKKLDLLVVMDMFMTESAQRADVVLPVAGWSEKDGTFTNTERRIQRVRTAVPAPEGTRQDWWIFCELARRMGYNGMDYHSSEDIWNELRAVVPKAFGGISYERLENEPGVCWPCPEENHPGTPVLHQGGIFSTVSGKAALYPVLFDPNALPEKKAASYEKPLLGSIAEQQDEEYPFLLTTGRRVAHYHTGTMTRKSSALNMVAPEELIELNPEDAQRLGVNDGDYIRVETRRGHIVARTWVTGRIQPGMVFGTFHYWEACCNELTNAGAIDPISGIPEFKCSAAKVTKSSDAEAAEWLRTISAKVQICDPSYAVYGRNTGSSVSV